MKLRLWITCLLAALSLAGCGVRPDGPPPGTPSDAARLEAAILALGPGVDPDEARRAAEAAYALTYSLAKAYRITDPPIVHNTKVNMGLRPRGLCWHWAEDMEKGLNAERFETLVIHRAIASADNPFRLDHSTSIISRRGDDMFAGIVLDPWRKGGVLTWVRTTEDDEFDWRPQAEVHAMKRRQMLRKQRLAALSN